MEKTPTSTSRQMLTIALIAIAIISIAGYFLWPSVSAMLNADAGKKPLPPDNEPKPGTDGGSDKTLTPPTDGAEGTTISSDAFQKNKAKDGGNDYVSAAAINKAILGKYKPYDESIRPALGRKIQVNGQSQYELYYLQIERLFGKPVVNEPLVAGFMKGMNLALRSDYLGIFEPYIKEYLSSNTKIPYQNVQVGEFLKA